MNSRGVVLFVTIWILAILIAFALGMGFRMSIDTRLTDYNVRLLKLLYLTKGAVARLGVELAKDESADCDSLNESWSNSEEFFKDVAFGNESFTINYIRKTENSEKIFYGAMDEQSRININRAPKEILLNLPGVTDEISDSILDWRDEDDIPHADGAESAYYLSLDFPYSCKNGPLQTAEELLLVKGVTPEIFNNIKDLITVYGDGKVNLNTADSRVMQALGLSEIVIQKILKYRAGDDGEEGTDDDNAFNNIANLTEALDLSAAEASEIGNLNSVFLLGSASSNFRVCVTAKTKNGKILKRTDAILFRSDKNNEIKSWYEY